MNGELCHLWPGYQRLWVWILGKVATLPRLCLSKKWSWRLQVWTVSKTVCVQSVLPVALPSAQNPSPLAGVLDSDKTARYFHPKCSSKGQTCDFPLCLSPLRALCITPYRMLIWNKYHWRYPFCWQSSQQKLWVNCTCWLPNDFKMLPTVISGNTEPYSSIWKAWQLCVHQTSFH